MTSKRHGWLAVTLGLLGCVSVEERGLQADLRDAEAMLAELATNPEAYESATPNFDGSPEGYVEFALAHDGSLRASWERWRAASLRVARERRLPMPSINYGVFVSPVETRVGPQRQRLSVRQSFPWPGELLAGADAAVAQARVMQREFEAAALALRATVVERYWQLWLVRRVRGIQTEQLQVLDWLADAARARLEVGRATVADVQQIDLAKAWLGDAIIGLDEAERQAAARLLASVGAPVNMRAPTLDRMPALERPNPADEQLRELLATHPRLQRWQEQEHASEERVREARQARAPKFAVGVDWIEVGPARTGTAASGSPQSGKDAVMINVGIDVPLWQLNYAADQKAFEADAAAARAEWTAGYARASGELEVTLAGIRDTARRAVLHEQTLIPQAETALASVLGNYASGGGELATILLAERDLLNLRLELARLHAGHAVAWAELERIVGRPTDGDAVETGAAQTDNDSAQDPVGGPRDER